MTGQGGGSIACNRRNRFHVTVPPTTLYAFITVPEERGEVFAHLQLDWCHFVLSLHLEFIFPCHDGLVMKFVHMKLQVEKRDKIMISEWCWLKRLAPTTHTQHAPSGFRVGQTFCSSRPVCIGTA